MPFALLKQYKVRVEANAPKLNLKRSGVLVTLSLHNPRNITCQRDTNPTSTLIFAMINTNSHFVNIEHPPGKTVLPQFSFYCSNRLQTPAQTTF